MLDMQVCRAYRMPHSEFLRWSAADRDKAIWFELRLAKTCRSCGTRPEEWEPSQGGHRRAYKAVDHICPGCELLEREIEQRDNDDAPKLRGSRVVLVPRGEAVRE